MENVFNTCKFKMIEKKFISQKGFLSTSFDKIIALWFAVGSRQDDSNQIPVLI